MLGAYHVGEFINRFRHGSLVMKLPDTDAAQIPTVLFGTVNGALGVIASLPQEQYDYLSRLQVRFRTWHNPRIIWLSGRLNCCVH